MIQLIPQATLTPDEYSARGRYVADARFFHAAAQGFSGLIQSDYDFNKIRATLAADVRALDQAIRKFQLAEPAILYSGHGNQLGVLGSLRESSVGAYAGLIYNYNGFISTSSDRLTVDRFIRTNASDGRFPVLLEFHLPVGFNLLNMSYAESSGEMEFLIGREIDFEIFGSQPVSIPQVSKAAVQLQLRPI